MSNTSIRLPEELKARVERLQHMQASGAYLTLDDLHGYATALPRGEQPAKPTPRTMTPQALTRFRASMRRTGRP